MAVSEWAFPVSNANSVWTTNTWSNLDRSTIWPSTPSTASYIQFIHASDAGDTQEYNLSVPTTESYTSISGFRIRPYGWLSQGGSHTGAIEFKLYVNGAATPGVTMSFSSLLANWSITAGTITYATTRSALQSGFKIRLTDNGDGYDIRIYAIGVEVIYADSNETTVFCQPISNASSNWNINSYANVAKSTYHPDTPSTGTYAQAIDGNDNQTQTWNLTVPTSKVYSRVKSVEAWVYCYSSLSASFKVRVKYGSTWTSQQTIMTYNTWQWHNFIWDLGSAALSDFATAFQVELEAGNIDLIEYFWAAQVYVKIHYEDCGPKFICRPTTNVNSLWLTNAAANIAEDVLTGNTVTVYNTTGAVTARATKNDDSEEQKWNLAAPSHSTEWQLATQVTVRVAYFMDDPATPAATLGLYIGATTQTATMNNQASLAWVDYAFTGSWTPAEFDSTFSVGVLTGVMGTNDGVTIHTLYAEVSGVTVKQMNNGMC